MTEQAFLALIGQHQSIIHKVCNLYAADPADREDLFQEILLQAWRGITGFQGAAKFSTWLYQVALNTAISHFRKAKMQLPFSQLDPVVMQFTAVPSEAVEAAIDTMYQAIGELSKIDKALIMLYLEDYDHKIIGEMLGITANHVGVKLNRIKGQLRELVKKHA
ncbi:MAG: sigma-70 family RNA polymerase sigma factor [Saprospiraceae bacterium]|nr:sigma-70 family RNA polymerase sigma factor [Saprospiraceae bacterium]MDZ4702820.1 sigma-70 family RNA polymerase sigma factor [Saprospiraceae bacterium]